jgi:hypothetical protein
MSVMIGTGRGAQAGVLAFGHVSEDDKAVRIRGAGAERDQREHVERAAHHRVPAMPENGAPAHSTTGLASAS